MDLPDLGLHGLLAKIDTGARTSSLHAVDVAKASLDDGSAGVSFTTFTMDVSGAYQPIHRQDKLVDFRKVTSSNGMSEERFVIATDLCIGSFHAQVEFTLTNRQGMRHPILLGRKALRHNFLIDAGRSYLLSNKSTANGGS